MTSELVLQIALREYDALRAEVVSTVERQYSLANWGTSSVAVVVAAAVAAWQVIAAVPALLPIVLMLIVPAITTVYFKRSIGRVMARRLAVALDCDYRRLL